jgi:hypothetical protein
MIAGGHSTHKTMTEQVEFLERFIAKHASSIIKPRTLQAKVMLSVEESSFVESNHIPSIGSTYEPPLEPRTLKEIMLHPSEFPIEFEDYGNTSKISQHEKHTKEVSPRVEPSKEWLMKVKRSSEAI